jgi:hypothetical protein
VIIQRNADFGPYTRVGDDGSKIESMTVKRKITSRHGVDSRPLSEWLRDAWLAAAGVRRFRLRRLAGAELSATAKTCSRAYPAGRQYYTRFSRFHGNNTGAASAVVRPKRRRAR